MSLRRLFVSSLAVVGLLLLSITSAFAHAEFVSATPAPGSTLNAAPTSVTIVFSEELSATGNEIAVTNAAGGRVDNSDTAVLKSDADRKTLTVSLKAGLPNGAYTVAWKNTAADGHKEEGNFSFGVGVAAPATLPKTGGEPVLFGGWLLLAALLLSVGGLLRRQA